MCNGANIINLDLSSDNRHSNLKNSIDYQSTLNCKFFFFILVSLTGFDVPLLM